MANATQKKVLGKLEVFLEKTGEWLDVEFIRPLYLWVHRAEIAQKKQKLLDRATYAMIENHSEYYHK
ncbi:MAG: hypothetical protein WC774_05230 [Candidatus Gracilibacteria bacterium]|jgi:hypothetical protein